MCCSRNLRGVPVPVVMDPVETVLLDSAEAAGECGGGPSGRESEAWPPEENEVAAPTLVVDKEADEEEVGLLEEAVVEPSL